jgi:hypothetical protein
MGLALSIGPNWKGLPEDGDRIQSPKRYVLKNKQDGVLDKNRTMENVQKHNICTNDFYLRDRPKLGFTCLILLEQWILSD